MARPLGGRPRLTGAMAMALAAVATTSLAACAPIPPPRIVAEADEVAASRSALEAKTFAPSAFAHAEKVRNEAHAALEHDRAAHAQILAEEAIAAFEEASALARVARAERNEQAALAASDEASRELGSVEAELARAQADADALETRLKITRDAQPITASGPASGPREEARKQAARAMSVQAKLLCTAARLLGAPTATADAAPTKAPSPAPDASKKEPDRAIEDPTSPAVLARDLGASEADIDKLDAALAGTGATPIDLATRARAGCLSVLTRVRRTHTPTSKAQGAGDALLSELSAYASREATGLAPGRDERGVSVTLERAFDGEALSSSAVARLGELDRVAAAHPDFAVAILLHSDKALGKGDAEKWRARADKVAAAFKSVPKDRVSALVAGNFSPLFDPHGKDKAKNLRVEIVFVSPESL